MSAECAWRCIKVRRFFLLFRSVRPPSPKFNPYIYNTVCLPYSPQCLSDQRHFLSYLTTSVLRIRISDPGFVSSHSFSTSVSSFWSRWFLFLYKISRHAIISFRWFEFGDLVDLIIFSLVLIDLSFHWLILNRLQWWWFVAGERWLRYCCTGLSMLRSMRLIGFIKVTVLTSSAR